MTMNNTHRVQIRFFGLNDVVNTPAMSRTQAQHRFEREARTYQQNFEVGVVLQRMAAEGWETV